jgi:hypothetical protein
MTQTAFNRMKNFFTSKLNVNLRKKLVKCYILSIALYSSERWTLRKVDKKYLEIFEMWCWRMIQISCTYCVRNEEELRRVKEVRNVLHTIKISNANWVSHSLRTNFVQNTSLNERYENVLKRMGRRGRRNRLLLDGLRETRGC